MALLTTAGPAYAEGANDNWDGGFGDVKPQRRSDLIIGLRVAPTLGWARGYPNDASKISDPQYLANTHAAGGFDNGFYLGGALRDWFAFALGLEQIKLSRSNLTAAGTEFTLRTEVFPAWTLGHGWRDVGVAMDFGLGSMKMNRGDTQVANGGAIGLAGIEVFYEVLHTGGFVFGPALGYQQLFSQSFNGNLLYFGSRVAFYSGP